MIFSRSTSSLRSLSPSPLGLPVPTRAQGGGLDRIRSVPGYPIFASVLQWEEGKQRRRLGTDFSLPIEWEAPEQTLSRSWQIMVSGSGLESRGGLTDSGTCS